MSKDTAEKRLTEYPDIAADVIDGIIFDGRPVIKAEDLILISGTEYTRDKEGKLLAKYRDVIFEDKVSGYRYAFWGIENQTGIDNTLPLSIIGYDYSVYKKQVDEYIALNKKGGNSAYAKRIHADQKLVPTVTIVLYYGAKWEGPYSLSDMLELKDREQLKPYLLNYHLNIVELGKDKEFYKRFHSDFRLVAQYVSIRNDKKALSDFMKDKNMVVKNTESFLDLMSEIGTDIQYKKIKERVLEREKKEAVTMCLIAEELVGKGREEGADLMLISLVCRKLKKGKDIAMIADELEEDMDVVERIYQVAAGFAPGYNCRKIYDAMHM